ncbi:peptidylprolyl isomerase [Candidatus Macondimonas diazotrophica]|uniref:Peptidylprolyl isomerase n=1 Tax=Candidatus Macondimonas diazotrophica TaxID=2305248 RepID=A0A4Z0F7U1_9GAMM|nr:peptidylprolyl isomerase [Candidatus Macondimonas diazotrophica]TFZ82404.1 peptidylprolyl isomerase [Candidatus Macondimonas diazotrophica]HBG30785.1 peptidylprolyl isomerase [Gammaproteobacteria bacterium]
MKQCHDRTRNQGSAIWIFGMLLLAWSLPLMAAELDRVVAVVNDGVVLRSELDNQIREIRARAAGQANGRLPPDDVLERQVLEQMIQKEIQIQLATRTGIKVSDDAVNQAIAGIARRNNMRLEDFIAAVEAQGLSYQALREDIRDDISIDQLRQREIARKIVVTDREIANQLETLEGLDDTENGAEDKKMMVSETRARHILMRPSVVMDEAKIRTTLADVRSQLVAGADFAELAKQYSEDPTADQGGELGWLPRGATVPEFQQVMDALEPGQVSEPFRSRFGWHLVQVLERRQRDATDEALREQARQLVFQRKLEEATAAWVRRLREEAYVEIRLDPAS